ncbi:MAG: type II secretion system F family protein [Pirellulales bacterium]|nr:type II secretion system F family protein [Pirellulales bacterium]
MINPFTISVLATLAVGLLLFLVALFWQPRRSATVGPLDALSASGAAGCLVAIVVASMLVLSLGAGLFVWGATIVVALIIFFRRLWIRREAYLGLLASAIERGVPLEPMLASVSQGRAARFGTKSQRLAALLQSGVSLPDALLRVPGLVPSGAVLAARCGQAAGDLPAALRDAADERSRRAELWGPFAGRLTVLGWTVFVGMVITSLWSRFIFPKLQVILEDFEIGLDWQSGPFGVVQRVADVSSLFLPIMPWIVLAMLYGLAVYIGIFPNVIPLGPLRRGWETGPLLRNLALFADAGKPFGSALDLLANEHPSLWMRRRLAKAARLADAGEPLSVALRSARLLNRTNAALVRAAEQAGNLGWGLRTVAVGSERRLAYRWNAIAQVGLPIATILVGAYVFMIALAQFIPLVAIIEHNL